MLVFMIFSYVCLLCLCMLISMLLWLVYLIVFEIRFCVICCRKVGLFFIMVLVGVKVSFSFFVLVMGVYLMVRWWNRLFRLMGLC